MFDNQSINAEDMFIRLYTEVSQSPNLHSNTGIYDGGLHSS